MNPKISTRNPFGMTLYLNSFPSGLEVFDFKKVFVVTNPSPKYYEWFVLRYEVEIAKS